jgi:D-alanyl-lipoteichoic acid acyltransferase DltB (MBOAT superfamily)
MPLGSGVFFAFLAAVFFLYWLSAGWRIPRLAIIFLANLLFCARYGLFYVWLLPLCSLADFFAGLGLSRIRNPWIRRLLLAASIGWNVGLLVASRHTGLVFPLSLSFYALQSLTYTFDLYRRDGEATPSILQYLAAASFFPAIQAGPINRLTELAKHLGATPVLSRADGGRAFYLIGMGVLKKALIADFLAENLVNRVFDTPKLYSGAEALIAVYAYSLQLYYDFSGYTDIARGAAMLMGIRMPINFDHPYLSSNITEFWRRWHLSFSNWLRDYIYFWLPGVRTKVMPYINLVITMLLGGLWHGLTWTFAIWGLLHGTALAVVRGWWAWRGRPRSSPAWRRTLAIVGTYHFVCLTWIFFRAGSVSNALELLGRIASLTPGFENITAAIALTILAGAGLLLVGKQWAARIEESFAQLPFYVHAVALIGVAFAVWRIGGRADTPFVYSRF